MNDTDSASTTVESRAARRQTAARSSTARVAAWGAGCTLLIAVGVGVFLVAPWRSARDNTQATPPPAPPALALEASPNPGATNVPADAIVKVTARNGAIDQVTVVPASGPDAEAAAPTAKDGAVDATAVDPNAVTGTLVADGSLWASGSPMMPGTTYRVTVVASPPSTGSTTDRHGAPGSGAARNATVTRTWTFGTVAATAGLDVRLTPGDGTVVGVGQPIIVVFDHPVVNKAQVETRLVVRTTPQVDGAWHWFSDREVHWRPETYWAAHTLVSLDADLRGIDAGNGVWGVAHRTLHFSIGDARVSVANAATHQMTVAVNGQVVRTLPISTGRDKYPTANGVHIVLNKAPDVIMDSATNGIPRNSPDGYYEHVYWDVRISNGGEYVHAAPWSVGDQGHDNVSHGCINVSVTDAQWFFGLAQPGDIVDVVNTPRPPVTTDAGMRDWNMSWATWVQGSALYQNPATMPRTTHA